MLRHFFWKMQIILILSISNLLLSTTLIASIFFLCLPRSKEQSLMILKMIERRGSGRIFDSRITIMSDILEMDIRIKNTEGFHIFVAMLLV